MRVVISSAFVLLLSFFISISFAEVMTYPFDNEVEELRFHSLLNELRCPKCQNQSLADSDAPIAYDLRGKVYELLQDGKSDQEIRDYLINRYGEFITYRPALKGSNWLLWLGPAFLLLFSLFMAFRVVSRANSIAVNQTSDSTIVEKIHD